MKLPLDRLRQRLRAPARALVIAALAGASVAAQPRPGAQDWQAAVHSAEWPAIAPGRNAHEVARAADAGPQFERGRSAAWLLAEHRRLDRALARLQPQRPGTVDAYVVVAGLDSDPVFGREARAAAAVLVRRYGAEGRNVVLAGSTGEAASELPNGSPHSLALALARVAELMDPAEDVLLLYTTSHGARLGLAYHDGDEGYGLISPVRLKSMLDQLGIRNRMLLLSACYSGVFVPVLADASTVLVTAASAVRTSFGCAAENDWTFFGDALVNHALREPRPFAEAVETARRTIATWEGDAGFQPSNPQVSIGARAADWLAPLERRVPRDATPPVGRPAIAALEAGGGEGKGGDGR